MSIKNTAKRSIAVALAILLILTGLALWIVGGNMSLGLTVIQIKKVDLPTAFDGYKIAQVSDLHNAEMGKDNEKLLSVLKESAPNIIVVTGDAIDSRSTDVGISLRFMQAAASIAPCYYVTGNHEARLTKEYPAFEKALKAMGVRVLRNEKTRIEKDGQSISLIGLDDPNFAFGTAEEILDGQLQTLKDDAFTVLLAHRPEWISVYAKHGVDLAFCGHAHGGQFRFFGQGMYAPGQGIFPKYTAGAYVDGKTSMVVSRGIGNSAFPFRLNNPPEVVLVELLAEK